MKATSILQLALCCLLTASPSYAGTLKTDILQGEKWWGAIDNFRDIDVKNPQKMPYDAETVINLDLINQGYGNQAVPFLVSTKGRYIWSDDPVNINFNKGVITVEGPGEIEISENHGTLRDAFLAAAVKHFPGNGQLPPEEFLRSPQYNTWIELTYNQNQKDILAYAHAIVDNGFPTDAVLMIDDNWQNYYGNFDFKPDRFPDPKAMSDELHRLGFKVMVWVCPFISPDSMEYRMLRDKGYLVKRPDSDLPAVLEWWNGQSAMLDMSNPEAYDWFVKTLRTVQTKYGVDGFKLDAGDGRYYPKDKIRVFDGKSYGTLHSELWARLGMDFPYNEFRACWKMAGTQLVQRLHDKDYSWEKGVAYLLPAMLASSMTGHLFVCPDMIGGGEFKTFLNVDPAKFDQDLIVRSAQIHALMPMMQFSVAPWRILDKEHLACCLKAANLHREFGDYIVNTGRDGSKDCEPIIRPMEYSFPGQGFETVLDQYMLGDDYLVAPMTTPGYSREVKLPKGRWIDELGRKYKGGKTYTIDVPIDRLPYFKKLK